MAPVESKLTTLTKKFNKTKCLYKAKRFVVRGDVKGFEDSCGCKTGNGVLCGNDCEHRLQDMNCHSDCHDEGTCENQFIRNKSGGEGLVLFHTREMGIGLKTLMPIRKDQYVISYIGELVDEATYKKRLETNRNSYGIQIKSDCIIDNQYYGNIARFVNHSCEPNLRVEIWYLDMKPVPTLWANRDILKGEELFYDYKLKSYPGRTFDCRCGRTVCRYTGTQDENKPPGLNKH